MADSKNFKPYMKINFQYAGKFRDYSEFDSEPLAVPIKLLGTEEEKRRLKYLVNRAAKTEIGRESLQTAADGGFTLSFAHADGIRGCCDQEGKYIQLSPRLSDDKLTSTLIHESRHASQFVNDGNEHFGIDDMKTQLMKMRVMEGDAQRAAVLGTWQLAELGDVGPYATFAQDRPEIYEMFSKAAEKYGGNSDEASTAAFKGWFDQRNTKTAYERGTIIRELSKASEKGKEAEYKFDNKISTADLIKRTCFKADGSNYFKGDKKEIDRGHFVDITNETKDFVKKWFDKRKEKHGLEPDRSMERLPTRKTAIELASEQIIKNMKKLNYKHSSRTSVNPKRKPSSLDKQTKIMRKKIANKTKAR